MSGTFPTSIAPSSLTWKSAQPTLVSVTHSLRRQVRTRGGQRWGLSLEYRDRKRAELAPLMAFALAQRGQYETFQIVPAILGQPQGDAAGTPLVNGAHAAGATSIATNGWSSGGMKAGDLVKFAGHGKVYLLTADATVAAGAMTLAIVPGLLSALANSEAVTVTNVPLTCALASDLSEWPIRPGVLMDMVVELVEAV